MSSFKKLRRTDGFQKVAAKLAGWYMRICFRTVRWQNLIDPEAMDFIRSGDPAILAIWHGRVLCGGPLYYHIFPDTTVYALASPNRDGRLYMGALKPFPNVRVVWGSSNNDGALARGKLQDILQTSTLIAIAPDGPKGPRHVAKPGIIRMAHNTGVPVLVASISVVPGPDLNSWDRMQIPVPFGRGAYKLAAPISLNDMGFEEAMLKVTDALIRVEQEVDAAVGFVLKDKPPRKKHRHAD